MFTMQALSNSFKVCNMEIWSEAISCQQTRLIGVGLITNKVHTVACSLIICGGCATYTQFFSDAGNIDCVVKFAHERAGHQWRDTGVEVMVQNSGFSQYSSLQS